MKYRIFSDEGNGRELVVGTARKEMLKEVRKEMIRGKLGTSGTEMVISK